MAITLNQHKEGITKLTIAKFSDKAAPKMGLAGFFPAQTTIEEELAIEVERNRQLIAVDVLRCTDPKLNTFSNYTEKIFKPPFFNEAFDFTKCRVYGVTFGNRTNPTQRQAVNLANEAQSNLETLRYKIMRAIEKMRADVLQTGIVTLVNGDSIDFKRKASSMPVLTGAAKWDTPATADPLTDLKAAGKFLRREGLSTGKTMNAIFGETAWTQFISNPKVLAGADFRRINRMDIQMPQFNEATGMTFNGQIAAGDFTINLWSYDDVYELSNGSFQQYIDDKNVVVLPNDFVGKTGYAGIPAIVGQGDDKMVIPVEAEFYIQNYVDQVKKAWWFEIASAPLPIPVSIDRIYTIKTS